MKCRCVCVAKDYLVSDKIVAQSYLMNQLLLEKRTALIHGDLSVYFPS